MTDHTDRDSNIENNIENEISNEAKATIKNRLESLINGNLKGTLNNQISNLADGNGSIELANEIINNLDFQVDMDISNDVTTVGKNQSAMETNKEEDSKKEKENTSSSDNNKGEEQASYIWGIDSASETTDEFYACVRENFGEPQVVARYLGTKKGISNGLTTDQIKRIHSNEAAILLIYNGFTEATGYENGVEQAKIAIQLAEELNVPADVAIFADIEPDYPVDAAFIEGWYDQLNNSSYVPAIYGIFDNGKELTSAFNKAVSNSEEILANVYLWSASPHVGITTEENAPDFSVDAPENSLAYGWQYGINAETCNIDTNLFNSNIQSVLWEI